MNIVARVATLEGPLRRGRVEVVSPGDRGPVAIGRGTINDGVLTAEAELRPVWGLRIDERAVIAVPVSATADVVELGEIVMVAEGVRWRAFHATDGRVYGVPREALPPPPAPPAEPPAPEPPLPRVKHMTFADMFGSTARQLSTVATAPNSNFALAGATVTLKGVPTATADAISLEFPTPETAGTGVGLSELSFQIKPKADAGPPAAPAPAPLELLAPDFVGYTREFAIRKAAAKGFTTSVKGEIVRDAANTGKVIRQLPPAGAPLAAGGLVRLYIGQTGEA